MQASSLGAMSSSFSRASCMLLLLDFVDRSPFLVLVICPFAVAVDGGRCFVMSSCVMPGNVVSSSGCLRRTLMRVEIGGEPNAWWWNLASSSLRCWYPGCVPCYWLHGVLVLWWCWFA